MKTAVLTKIALVLAALYLVCPGMSRAETPEYDITIGRTIHTDKPVCLVYRHDGFWVTQAGTADTLRHYTTDGTLLAEYQLPGSVLRFGVAWDGAHWWIGDNNYGSETIYKCELNDAEKRLEPVRAYDWPYLGPCGLEWAQGYLWVSDDATDVIYRVSVGDTSFTAIEPWCSTNPEPWDLAWDGTNIWSITGPGGGFDPVMGEREIYKHDAAGNIIEIWHYPPADDPAAGSYGGFGTGLAFAGSQLWYCDMDRNEIIEAIRPPGDLKGRIAFLLGAEQKLYVMNADGTSRQQVPLPPLGVAAPNCPQWSRDGLWLTFYGGGGWAHNGQIFIVRPDGSGFRQLTDTSGNFVEPDFSPDGTQIVFHQVYGNMYIINTDGAGLIDLGVAGSATRWSPDGRYILYTNWGTFTYDSDLFLYDLTTGQSTQITHHAPGQAFNRADWSPDGKKLAVDGLDRVRIQYDVWTMNADGSNLVNLTPDWTTSNDGYATWSPDGKYILFTSNITGNSDIWCMRPDGSGRINITNSPEDELMPVWGIAAEPPPPPPTIYYVDAVNGNDNNNGLSRRTAFATISKGIDSATNRYKVLVYPGVYQEEVDFKGKAITVQGVATKVGIPVIENPGDFAVSFYNGEGPRSILKNFVIKNSFMAIFIAGSSPTLKNLNIIGNKYGIEAYAGAEPKIANCIFYNNSDSDIFGCEARYSCTSEPGQGNIAADPCFVDLNNGDYHLLSQRGRYWHRADVWVLDRVTSPCIDGGDPDDDVLDEPMPNGGRIDMGAFGGTPFASMSDIKWLDGDINHDGRVNLADLAMLTENWLSENSP